MNFFPCTPSCSGFFRKISIGIVFVATSISGNALNSQSAYNVITKEKTVTIGIAWNYPPLNILEDGARSGIEMEMINSLAEFLGARAILVPLKVSEYVKALEDGRVQLVIAGMSRNLNRASRIWFSDPYISAYPAALLDSRLVQTTKFGQDIEEAPPTNLWDLNQAGALSFIVKEGSVYEDLVKSELHSENFVKVSSNEEALQLLRDFKANAFLHDSLYLEYQLKHNPGMNKSFMLLRAVDRDEQICVGLPFGDVVLKNQVNTWIAELIRTKKIHRWIEKYLKK